MDYSRHTAVPRPHDLVWIEPDALGEHIAPWALARVAAGQPVVVRRARRDAVMDEVYALTDADPK